ncbi:MAG: hypothetical protein ACHQ50_09330 [Fimbriimonadales bacterium]
MILGAVLAFASIAAPDQSGWHNYMPDGSGVRFAMPGTVRGDSKPDPTGGAKVLSRYRSIVNGNEFTIVFGDVANDLQATVQKLWDLDRSGATVKKILANTLNAANTETGGKVVFSKFGDLKGFPMLAEMLQTDDGLAVNEVAAFTKRGVVVARAKTPKTEGGVKEGIKFIGSLNLSARM